MMKVAFRNDSVVLDGYVNAVDRDSRPIPSADGKFIERISPGAFKEALERAENVDLMVDHKLKIGSIKEKNLKLFEDAIGLRAQCVITNPEIIQKAKKKLLRGWSFGFIAINQRAEEAKDGMRRRIIEKLDLLEVSIIDDKMIPCYIGTSIEERAEEEKEIEIRSYEDNCEYEESDSNNNFDDDLEKYKKKVEVYRLKS